MAKVGAALDPGTLAPALALAVRYQTAGAARRAIFAAPMPATSTAEQIRLRTAFAEAVTAWNDLRPWKRARWTFCAYRQGNPANPPSGWDGWSGFSLYVYCWLTQHITTGKQPVSPCSRRVTDPQASPYDWTP